MTRTRQRKPVARAALDGYTLRDLDVWIDDMKTGTNGARPSTDLAADDYLARLDK